MSCDMKDVHAYMHETSYYRFGKNSICLSNLKIVKQLNI
jgi:hypothetical protein